MVAKARDTAPFSSRDAQKKKKSTTEKKVKRGHAASVGRPTKPPHERARVVQRRGGGGDRAGPPAQRRCAGVPSAGVPAAQCGTQAVSPFQRPRRGGGGGGQGARGRPRGGTVYDMDTAAPRVARVRRACAASVARRPVRHCGRCRQQRPFSATIPPHAPPAPHGRRSPATARYPLCGRCCACRHKRLLSHAAAERR